MYWQGEKVLVTGAGGFIGSHLTEEVVRLGANTRVFLRYNSRDDKGLIGKLPKSIQDSLEVFVGDIKDPEAVRKSVKGCDMVFHLAALIAIPYSYVNPFDFVQTNVLGTANILNACLDNNISKIVHTSTSEVYGTARYVPIDEEHPIQPQSPYSASKVSADALAMSYFCSFGLPVSIIRPFNTFGPRQSLRAIIPTIVLQALKKDEIKVGSIKPTRDFNFIDDTVDSFILMAENEKSIGEVINIGSGKEITIEDLVYKIAKIMNKEVKIITEEARVRPERSEVFRLCANNKKAKEILDWSPKISLEEGLEKVIAWMILNAFKNKVDKYVL